MRRARNAVFSEILLPNAADPFMYNQYMKGLNTLHLMHAAPSVFADEACDGMSPRYEFVPTSRVVDALSRAGWTPVLAVEQRVRRAGRIGYQKHMIRFRMGSHRTVGDTLPELVLTNSHDGRSSFKIQGGLFRLVCGNGLVVATKSFGQVTLRHVGFDDNYAVSIAEDYARRLPEISDTVEAMQSRILSPRERRRLAREAIQLRWPGNRRFRIRADHMLGVRRMTDAGANLWLTYNVIQENLMQGGVETRERETGKILHTRPIRSIDETLRVNEGLWGLAANVLARPESA